MRCQPSLDVAGERVLLAGQLQAAFRTPAGRGLLAAVELEPGEAELGLGLGGLQSGAGGEFKAGTEKLLRLRRLTLEEEDIRQPAARGRLQPRLARLIGQAQCLV